jgi:hypothetical protein
MTTFYNYGVINRILDILYEKSNWQKLILGSGAYSPSETYNRENPDQKLINFSGDIREITQVCGDKYVSIYMCEFLNYIKDLPRCPNIVLVFEHDSETIIYKSAPYGQETIIYMDRLCQYLKNYNRKSKVVLYLLYFMLIIFIVFLLYDWIQAKL